MGTAASAAAPWTYLSDLRLGSARGRGGGGRVVQEDGVHPNSLVGNADRAGSPAYIAIVELAGRCSPRRAGAFGRPGFGDYGQRSAAARDVVAWAATTLTCSLMGRILNGESTSTLDFRYRTLCRRSAHHAEGRRLAQQADFAATPPQGSEHPTRDWTPRLSTDRASQHGLGLRECPFAIQDFGARAIEAHHVVPASHDRQAVRNFAVAAAELDGDRAVGVFGDRDGIAGRWREGFLAPFLTEQRSPFLTER